MDKNFLDRAWFVMAIMFGSAIIIIGLFMSFKLGTICQEIEYLSQKAPVTPLLIERVI